MSWFANLFPKHTILGKMLHSKNESRGIHLDKLLTPGGIAQEVAHLPENIAGFVTAQKKKGDTRPTSEIVAEGKGLATAGKLTSKGKVTDDASVSDDKPKSKMMYIIFALIGFFFLTKKSKL